VSPAATAPGTETSTAGTLRFDRVGLQRGDRWTLSDITWTVAPRERWVVLGPNGSGKTTLVRLAGGWLHPTTGTVTVLGKQIGRTDVRSLRTRIAFASASISPSLRPALSAADVVVTARHAALETWWHHYTDADHARARALLERVGCGTLGDREFGTLSEGERQRVLLARSLMPDPELILLDEPTAALDLSGREALVTQLTDLAGDATVPPIVFITHHVEEIPPGFTHALVLKGGRVLAAGPVAEVMTAEMLSEAYDIAVRLERTDGRYWAWAG
jgi:iron complex transport system ATP-binding protein